MRLKDRKNDLSPKMPAVSDARFKKSSYYVWFLGVEECWGGCHGPDVIQPIIEFFLERERDIEPDKVTLQISNRGIKLLQQGFGGHILNDVKWSSAYDSKNQFFMSGALKYVHQEAHPDDDIVAAVLLPYNPGKECPVQIHAYRCDSTETAALLRGHLEQLLLQPEHQVKLLALESTLASQGLNFVGSSLQMSDCTTSGSSNSSSSGTVNCGGNLSAEKIASLYDSLAAELRDKLGSNSVPLLLPPKDYDNSYTRPKEKKGKSKSGFNLRVPGNGRSTKLFGTNREDVSVSPMQQNTYVENQILLEAIPGENKNERKEQNTESDNHRLAFDRNGKEVVVSKRRQQRGKQLRQLHVDLPTEVDAREERVLSRKSSRAEPDKRTVGRSNRFQDAKNKFLSLEQKHFLDQSMLHIPNEYDVSHLCSSDLADNKAHRVQKPKRRENKIKYNKDSLATHYDKSRNYEINETQIIESQGYQKVPRSGDMWQDNRVDESRRKAIVIRRNSKSVRHLNPSHDHQKMFTECSKALRLQSVDKFDYQKAKSMHDLSQQVEVLQDNSLSSYHMRRRSLNESPDPIHLEDYPNEESCASQSFLYASPSTGSNSSLCSSSCCSNTIGETTTRGKVSRVDNIKTQQNILRSTKKTFDYPVNGGHAPIQIAKAYHDDYRRFQYDRNITRYHRQTDSSEMQY